MKWQQRMYDERSAEGALPEYMRCSYHHPTT